MREVLKIGALGLVYFVAGWGAVVGAEPYCSRNYC